MRDYKLIDEIEKISQRCAKKYKDYILSKMIESFYFTLVGLSSTRTNLPCLSS